MTGVEIRPMRRGDIKTVCAMVLRVFDQFIAPLHDAEGAARFGDYVNPVALAARLNGHFVLVAEVDRQIIGVVEMREYQHVSMLFVAAAYQGQGISRRLWDAARTICLEKVPDTGAFTVNSAPNAVAVYTRFGFVPTDVEQIRNSIRYTPMRLTLET